MADHLSFALYHRLQIIYSSQTALSKKNQPLDIRVAKVQGEITIAAFIYNMNVRGRIIEYLITDNGLSLKTQIINALNNTTPITEFKTEDKLGDYTKKVSELLY